MRNAERFRNDYRYKRADNIARICSKSKEIDEVQTLISEKLFEGLLDAMVMVYDAAYNRALLDCETLDVEYPNTELS